MAAVDTPSSPPPSGFDPYGQLIRMLMPRAQVIGLYAPAPRVLWVSEGQDDSELQAFAAELLAGGRGKAGQVEGTTRHFDGANAYAFTLRDATGSALAVAGVYLREDGEPRPLSLVLGLLRPALECLQRELTLRASMGSIRRDLSSRDRDLELLLDAPPETGDAASDAHELSRLVQGAVDHLGASVGALIIPERAIAIVRVREGRARGEEAQVISRAHRHLLTWAQLQRRTLLVNKIASHSEKLPPYKILSVPVRHSSERVTGFLAFLNEAAEADFDTREMRLAELLGRKVGTVLLNNYDAATGLLARGPFERQVESLLARRTMALNDAMVYLDIDQMHVINENFGMHVGDQTIARVAEVIRRKMPADSLAARISGDRFAIFLPNIDADRAREAVEFIRQSVAELTETRPEGTLRVSVSAGLALVGADSRNPLSHALATAEIANKAAKDHGRDRVETFTDSDLTMVRRHGELQIVAELREALATDRFRLYAQPILPLAAGSAGPRFEILIRLQNEKGELLPPAKFLPAAESYQLMTDIDRWVVGHALEELGAYASVLTSRVSRFAINLSGQSVVDPAMAEFIKERIQGSLLPADIISFELTETAAVTHLDRAEAFMHSLKAIGCNFALDDFGTGASSLAYLQTLPVSFLKIDGSFVRDVLQNPRSESMVKTIAQLARGMGIATVAEYVETDELRVRMANLGVDYGQGFAIGRPIPLSEVLQDLSLYELIAPEALVEQEAPLLVRTG